MKRNTVLAAMAILLLASPLHAYTPVDAALNGNLKGTLPALSGPVVVNPGSRPLPGRSTRGVNEATPPVPEPGTITLASMGLLALGAAWRKRKNPA